VSCSLKEMFYQFIVTSILSFFQLKKKTRTNKIKKVSVTGLTLNYVVFN